MSFKPLSSAPLDHIFVCRTHIWLMKQAYLMAVKYLYDGRIDTRGVSMNKTFRILLMTFDSHGTLPLPLGRDGAYRCEQHLTPKQMLETYGISPDTEAAYTAMPAHEPATVETFTCQLPATVSITRILNDLKRSGLAAENGDGRWLATPLPVATAMLENRRVADLERAAHQIHALNHAVADDCDREHGLAHIDRLDSRDAILEFLWKTCATTSSMRAFYRPPYGVVRDQEPSAGYYRRVASAWQILDRGGTIRTVYHPGFCDAPLRRRELAFWIGHGEQAPFAEVSTKLMIADQTTIMVPSMSQYFQMAEAARHGKQFEPRMAVIRGHDILHEIFSTLFEQTWNTGLPLSSNSNGTGVVLDTTWPKCCWTGTAGTGSPTATAATCAPSRGGYPS